MIVRLILLFLLITGCNGVTTKNDTLNHQDEEYSAVKKDSDDSPDLTINEGNVDALVTAALNNDLSLAKALLDSGVNVNGRISLVNNTYVSALRYGVHLEDMEMVELLLQYGADPNLDLGGGMTPFHYAAGASQIDVFEMLLKHGGNVNEYNKFEWNFPTPVSFAIAQGKLENVKRMLDHGLVLDPDSINGFSSPLARAVYHGEVEIATELIRCGANINATFSEPYEDCEALCPEGITVLHALVEMSEYADKDIVAQLLDIVLSASPDLNIKNGLGYTPLELALFTNNNTLAERLVKNGAKLDASSHLAIHLAAKYSNFRMTNYLIKQGINVNIQDEHGNTALLLCLKCCGGGFGEGITQEDRLKIIELLLDNGADPTIKNSYEESFLELVKKNWYPKITSALITRGIIVEGDVKDQKQ